MKLLGKLTLFITLSKLAIVMLFVMILPGLVDKIASEYTDYYLREQKNKVLGDVKKKGMSYYLQGSESYGGYTLLKEEYISLEPVPMRLKLDTIQTADRLVEQDTLTYRILSHTFAINNKNYLLEVGKTTATANQYKRPLQRFTLYVLISLIFLTLLIDLVFTRFLLRPLGLIIKTKILNQKFPFDRQIAPVKTSTVDFKYLDDSLIKLMEQVNEAFGKEREFTANASHELMTPVSILQSKIENLLLQEDLSEFLQQRLIEMMKTLNRLKKIVRSLLLISRIDNEQFSKADRVNVKELMQEIIEEIGHRLEEKEIEIQVVLTDDIVLKGCNHDLLFQFFYNLINNAIKYNKSRGKIVVSDLYRRDSDYAIHISDTGIGIPADDLNSIFDRFKKSEQTIGGYGLGLAIVKSIGQYHNIDIKVESVVGKGTTFSLLFPPNTVERRLQEDVV